MKRKLPGVALVCGLLLLGASCGGSVHIDKYVPKHRIYDADTAQTKADAAMSPGSLWRDGRSPAMLYTDARALRDDLVVVKIQEIADAKRAPTPT